MSRIPTPNCSALLWTHIGFSTAEVCHFKDYKIDSENKPDFAEIGTGNLDLDECYRACRESGVGYIVIEQDTCDIDPRESMAISYKNLIDIAKRNS